MNRFLPALLVFLLYACLAVWYYTCQVQQNCIFQESTDDLVEEPVIEPEEIETPVEVESDSTQTNQETESNTTSLSTYTTSGMSLDHNGVPVFNYSQSPEVRRNNGNVSIPYANRNYGIELKQFMDRNPDLKLVITGIHSTDETEDIGMARANYIAGLLANAGITRDKIQTLAASYELTFNASNVAQGGIKFDLVGIGETPTTSQNSTETQQPSSQLPVAQSSPQTSTEPFAYRSFSNGFQDDVYNPNAAFKAYAVQVKQHLDAFPSKRVVIYAHTDGIGNASDNFEIGKTNASIVKRYLNSMGIPNARISALSKGETEPLPAARRANGEKSQRIEIIVQ